MRNLQTIAESASRLGEGLRTTEPGLPGRAIAAFWNLLLPDYFDIDIKVVCSVVDKDVSKLVAAVDRTSKVIRTRRP